MASRAKFLIIVQMLKYPIIRGIHEIICMAYTVCSLYHFQLWIDSDHLCDIILMRYRCSSRESFWHLILLHNQLILPFCSTATVGLLWARGSV